MDKHPKRAGFLDVESDPDITFKSAEEVQTGADTMRLNGHLTVKGQTAPAVPGVGLYVTVSSDTVDLTISAQMRAGGWPE